ncbi:MAG TPA: heme-copper oxidase subunit III [Chloroflexota bacterium]|jgi:cytochrome c oxidase subunit 3|nr:heme-copper oxidase subunit III [Chloroflexota bacterium]
MAVVTPGPTEPVPAAHAPTGLESLDVRKLGMWTFLGSECVFFGALITTYFIYRPMILAGEPKPHEVLDINFTALLAFILLMSSLTMVLALSALQHNHRRAGSYWLLATALLGTLFLGGQTYEFTKLAQEGVTLTSGIFGQCFLLLTGFHGTHVFVGVLWLLACFARAIRGGFHGGNFVGVEIAGLYWHFVDVVWVAIFTLIYLIP